MAYNRIVHIFVGKTNHDPCDLVDVARWQVDHLGPVGIRAKRDQTNARFLKTGYLRFVFPTRQMRQRFLDRVEEHCHPAVTFRIYRRRRAA